MWVCVSDGVVVQRVSELPQYASHIRPRRGARMRDMGNGVGNLHEMTTEELNSLGWFQLTEIIPPFNPATEKLVSMGYTITPTEVVETFEVVGLPPDEIISTMSKLDFRARFTLEELVAIKLAKQTGSDLVRAQLEVMEDNLNAASNVDLYDSRTILGVNILVSMGLLNSERATAILSL